MNKNKKLIIIAAVLISLIFTCINKPADASDEISPEALAVTLVIDNSGSMKSTDLGRLRETAANIFIDLLSPEDYISIITFNTKQKVVIPMQQIKTSSNKADFKKILSQNVEESGDTDYLGALNEGSKQLNSVNKGNVRKVILFLTDGEPDPNMARKKDIQFMNSYMDSLWKSISNLALKKYSVYSVGFSKGINPAVLERISKDTQGSLKISNDSRELALSFFNILGNLKNRKEFFNETLELKGGKSLEFNLDENTAQTTMVFSNPDGKPLEVTLFSPDGKAANSGVIINKYDKYSIVTINQKNEKNSGKWKVNLKGNGNITVFGNKDLFIKTWIVSPGTSSLHPLNEPLEISAFVTGEVKEGVSAEAIITKEGVKDKTPVKLTFKDGRVTGIYKNADKLGEYNIDVRLMLNGQVITENSTTFTVRELPSIYTDFPVQDSKYKLGDNLIVTSSLNMKGNKLINGDDLKIENYNLLLNYTNQGPVTIPLLDNGSVKNEDIKENDGIWSNRVLFNKADGGNASIMVNGTYNGEKFLLEKSLGNFRVYAPGKIIVNPLKSIVYTTLNRQLKIPLEIENTSNLTENITISMDKALGELSQSSIRIEPLKKGKIYIYVKLNKNLKNKTNNISFKLTADDGKTKIEHGTITFKVKILSKAGYLLIKMIPMICCLLIFAALVLLIILLGLLLYKKLVYKTTIIQGWLMYFKESDLDHRKKKLLDFDTFKKDKIIISFNKENTNADFRIFDTNFNYDIELDLVIKKSRWKFIDGYKALIRRSNSSELLLKTTEPGIFTYEDKIYTSKKVYKNDKFISGGYVFQYIINPREKTTVNNKGKNVLLGRG